MWLTDTWKSPPWLDIPNLPAPQYMYVSGDDNSDTASITDGCLLVSLWAYVVASAFGSGEANLHSRELPGVRFYWCLLLQISILVTFQGCNM